MKNNNQNKGQDFNQTKSNGNKQQQGSNVDHSKGQYRDQNRDTKGSQASPNRNLGKETSQQNGSKSYEQKNLEKQAHNQNGSNKHFEQKNHSQTNQNLDIENGQSNYEKNTYRNNK